MEVTEAQIATIVHLWKVWDARPSNKQAVDKLEDELQLISKQIDMKASDLRDFVNKFRHQGLKLEDAIREVL